MLINMGSCLGIGHNYARVSNSYEFDIETLQNSIDIKTKTIESTLKHLELKYNNALNKINDEIKKTNYNSKELKNNLDIKINNMESNVDIRIGNLELQIQDTKLKANSVKRKFRDLGKLINNDMSSSENSINSGIFKSETSEYTETAPDRPATPIPSLFRSSFTVSRDSAFNEFKNDN
jgi:predicted RNase H-like nuclease (RuvC/YqgF family)